MSRYTDTQLLDFIEKYRLEVAERSQWKVWTDTGSKPASEARTLREALTLAVAQLVAEKLSPSV